MFFNSNNKKMKTKLKVKCIAEAPEKYTERNISVGKIYEVIWIDDGEYQLRADDKGKPFWYDWNLFETVDFDTIIQQ